MMTLSHFLFGNVIMGISDLFDMHKDRKQRHKLDLKNIKMWWWGNGRFDQDLGGKMANSGGATASITVYN